jgi:nitrate reductase assembly molybdenum cofactor insertion protein NarJ
MKTENTTIDLLNEAAEWRMISLLFECPVGDWIQNVRKLAGEVADPELKKAAEFAETQAGEGLYHAIFGPGGPAPAREISYRDWVQPGYLLSELAAFYDAFSYRPESQEVPDHIAVETGFIAYLKMKEAYARECENQENVEITSGASKTFIDEHLTKVSERIATTLAASEIDYLQLASAALFNRVGVDKDNKIRQILPVLSDPEAEIECAV